MKKSVIIMCLLCLILCFAGCDKSENHDKGKDTSSYKGEEVVILDTLNEKDNGTESDKTDKIGVRYAERVFGRMLSEAGVFEIEDGKIYIYTLDENERMVLCYDPNCGHWGGVDANGDLRCMASISRDYDSDIGYYEGAVYLFERVGNEKHRLYKMETNSATRELVAELPHSPYLYHITTFCEDKLYYPVQILHLDETTGRGHYTYRMIEVNLIDGLYRFISEEDSVTFDLFDVQKEYYIVRKYDSYGDGKPYFIKVDLDTLEEKVIISKEEYAAGSSIVDIYDEDSYFYWDSTSIEIGIKNFDGTVEKVLLKGQDRERFHASVSDKWIMYKRSYEYEGEKPGWYFMSLDTGEVIDITEVQKKYNLQKYDGYYDAFVGQNQDGQEVLNPTLYSREKILAEAQQ